ncbi:hypothetical protein MAQ5080_03057 [Marinomonas aquimarina]|uniref:Uncharacterized protein n=1 Tax=Marinomonas aquimarina TaxID=295068 RepID=A0A1A8TM43_9GAMM|nr:hypothetical protein [Marinomonas aquimarina]SBS35046.1 hypothetical protein MAQ5080_03057 [Marinomonas aquimarina]
MKIGGNFPAIPQGGSDYSHRAKVPAVVNQEQQSASSSMPSPVQSFEQASSAQSARFFKVDGLSALAQQAVDAYQSTEALSPNNPVIN